MSGNSKKSLGGLPYRRIVVKMGTRLLTGGGSELNLDIMAKLVGQVAQLHRQGAETIIVSSGAIASGRHKLGLSKKIRGIPYKQVLASVGQGRLMNTYERLFEQHDITVAQALLTKADLSDRAGYLNARNTLLALLELRVVGIVNENDVVSIDEIKEAKFGDNDNLSAMVANLVDADLLMILTDIGGLYTADPSRDPAARLIPEVRKVDAGIKRLGAITRSNLGTGGMVTKIEAAALATSSGVDVIIADGREPDAIVRLASGEAIGTHFLPAAGNLESRQRWMVSGLCTRGKLIVDGGAALALRKQNRSLLAAGITRAEGKFARGDIVAIYDAGGTQLGCGISNYSSGDIGVIKGAHSTKIAGLLSFDYGPEVVHRNNLALLEREEPSAHRETIPVQR
ncbi:MAG TPA: glutamate 5-kinase [Dehalococcoidales bacterium]|nr:MAG: glutamate 5-kinase [Chloroflexi bacterium RBG_16_60_22]HJX12086.1 glutamate 5-kinase [Dehalococcoidales bacterium]